MSRKKRKGQKPAESAESTPDQPVAAETVETAEQPEQPEEAAQATEESVEGEAAEGGAESGLDLAAIAKRLAKREGGAEEASSDEPAEEADRTDQTDQPDPTDQEPSPEPAEPDPELPEVAVSEPQLSGAEVFAAIEALLFASDRPLTPAQIARALPQGIGAKEVRRQLAAIVEALADSERGFELREIAGGWQLLSREKYAPYVQRLRRTVTIKKLSGSALETLAVIAYKQPVGRAEIERIRGVNAGEMLRSLLEKRLVRIAGRSEELGNALLYGTTQDFLEHFGLKSIAELPRSAELSRKPAPKKAESEASKEQPAAEAIGLATTAPGEAPAAEPVSAPAPADASDQSDPTDPTDKPKAS